MSPSVVGGALVACAAALLAAHVAALVLSSGHASEVGEWFHLDREFNVPTLYSAALLLLVAMLLVDTGHQMRIVGAGSWRSWRFLAICFVFLSVDEVVQFHESLNNRSALLLESLNLPVLHGPWVVPYAGLAILVCLLSLRFLQSLDTRARLCVVLAGAIYSIGAISMEMLGSWRIAALGGNWNVLDPMYLAVSMVEEACEMGGVSLMLYALVKYRHDRFGGVLLSVSPIPALGILLAGAWAVAHLSDPLRSLIGGRASMLLLAGAYFAAMLVTVLGMRHRGRDRAAPAAAHSLHGGDAR